MKAVFLAAVLLLLSSCAGRELPDVSVTPEKAAELAGANTPVLCGYKGRIAVKAEERGESVSFNALLDKNCSGKLSITLLGALNSVLARMDYSRDGFSVEASDPDIKNYLNTAGVFYAVLADRYIKSPLMVPDGGFVLSAEKDSYVFTGRDGVKIYADGNFRLYKYFDGNSEAVYGWDGASIRTAELSGKDGGITIRFLNGAGWKGPAEGR